MSSLWLRKASGCSLLSEGYQTQGRSQWGKHLPACRSTWPFHQDFESRERETTEVRWRAKPQTSPGQRDGEDGQETALETAPLPAQPCLAHPLPETFPHKQNQDRKLLVLVSAPSYCCSGAACQPQHPQVLHGPAAGRI